ncbi:hypothetical protein J4206_05710, partial [Candidatus Woesearchaeota archaeon]|nr:hypothetical protein [Candidatus Woesearchaeota archaeon]
MEDKKESDEIDLKELKDSVVKFTKGLFAAGKDKQHAHNQASNEDSSEDKDLDRKRQHIIHFLKEKKDYIIYSLLAFVIWIATSLRLQNLPILVDVTTGKYVAADL